MIRVRLPEELKARLEASHEANGRSLTAEIRLRLEESFQLEDANATTPLPKVGGMKFLKAAKEAGLSNLQVKVDSHSDQIAALEDAVAGLTKLLSETRKKLKL